MNKKEFLEGEEARAFLKKEIAQKERKHLNSLLDAVRWINIKRTRWDFIDSTKEVRTDIQRILAVPHLDLCPYLENVGIVINKGWGYNSVLAQIIEDLGGIMFENENNRDSIVLPNGWVRGEDIPDLDVWNTFINAKEGRVLYISEHSDIGLAVGNVYPIAKCEAALKEQAP